MLPLQLMNTPPHRQPRNVHRALLDREAGLIPDHVFRAAVYTDIVPSSTFVNITDVPNVSFRRFTPCGRYLIATAHNYRDVVVFRVEAGGRRCVENSASSSHVPSHRAADDLFKFDNFAYGPFAVSDRAARPHTDRTMFNTNSSPYATPLFHDPTRAMPGPVVTRNGLLAHLPIPLIPPPTPPMPQHAPPASHHASASSAHQSGEAAHSCTFARFFTKLYEAPVPIGADTLIREFCLVTPNARFLILASFLPREAEADTPPPPPVHHPRSDTASALSNRTGAPIPALATSPVLQNFTLHLVDVETGRVADRFSMYDDYVHLDGHASVHMFSDVLCVLSVRFQTVYVIKVQESLGRFTVEGSIGYHCRPDDVFAIAKAREAETSWRRRHAFSKRARNGMNFSRGGASSSAGAGLGRGIDGANGNGGFGGGEHPTGNGADDAMSHNQDGRGSNGVDVNPEGNGDVDDDEDDDGGGDDDDNDGNNGNANGLGGGGGGQGDDSDGNAEAGEQRVPAEPPPTETGLGNGKLRDGFYSGLMQRLLVYVYRQYLREGKQSLFYRVVGQYSLLLMQKVQLLDADHLLIRLGSYDRGGKVTDASTNTCFFVVYCISSTVILNLFENKSSELWDIYELHRDNFIGDAAVSATFPPSRNTTGLGGSSGDLSGGGGGGGAEGPSIRNRSQRRSGWPRPSVTTMANRDRSVKRTRAMLSALPFSSQSRNVSPYLDRSLFSYNIDLLPALDGTKALSLKEVKCFKFRCARNGIMRFKLAPSGFVVSAHEDGDGDDRGHEIWFRGLMKTKMLFLFHPHVPLVLSMEHSANIGARLNIHVYGHDDRKDDHGL